MNKAQAIFLIIIGYIILIIIMYDINKIICMWMFLVPWIIIMAGFILYLFYMIYALLGEWDD